MKRLLIASSLVILGLSIVTIKSRIEIENLTLDKAQLKYSLDSAKMQSEVYEAQLKSNKPYIKPLNQQEFQRRYDSLKTLLNYDPEKYRENGQ